MSQSHKTCEAHDIYGSCHLMAFATSYDDAKSGNVDAPRRKSAGLNLCNIMHLTR